jgi:hypothetical protein
MELKMKKYIFITSLFLSIGMVSADDHKEKGQKINKLSNHPNYLLSPKECKETKEAIGGLLLMSDKIWKELEKHSEHYGEEWTEKEWAKASFVASTAADYSIVYDVWCKDMMAMRTKMMLKKKMKDKKEG